ncbi:MAG: tRNA glutamyl-Q(34) synthetase GluQRS [Verrucomicrobiota bacterium JB023]|nr:tRNA glutamyl-Q(34) synthetase GluQRS [Verrucomicrobiota bacterium JB023]
MAASASVPLITRFAPSPTGWLHLGHAYSACLAYEKTREAGGQFFLRFEDIDHTRVREHFYPAIEEDLKWLGINWEGKPLRQLERMTAYEEALGRLRSLGVLYPCFCTRKDLALAAPQQGDGALVYPGTCRNLNESERVERVARESHAWRIDMKKAAQLAGPLTFHDQCLGEVQVEPELLGDVVLARKDLATSYHLAVVVDDAYQGITSVTRGEDLLESTHVHRVLQALLGLPGQSYYHHRLVVDEEGKRLAKRHDSLSIRKLREEGCSPDEVKEMAIGALES